MNIFMLDYNPQEAAKQHCDKHVVKMILESAQMLCTVANELGFDTPYKSTHKNHPCTLWVARSAQNYQWLVDLMYYLNEEYMYRYNHDDNHISYNKLQELDVEAIKAKLPDVGFTQPAQAMPEYCKNDDAVRAYRKYYVYEKYNILQYTRTKEPEWLEKVRKYKAKIKLVNDTLNSFTDWNSHAEYTQLEYDKLIIEYNKFLETL